MTYGNRDIQRQLNRIESAVNRLLQLSGLEIGMEIRQMHDLTRLTREVEETRGAAASTKVLVQGLVQKIKDLELSNPDDQAKLDELADSLQSSQDDLASAVDSGSTPPDAGASAGGVTG